MLASVVSQPASIAPRVGSAQRVRGAAASAIPAASSSSFAGVRLAVAARARRAGARLEVVAKAAPRAMAVEVASAPGAWPPVDPPIQADACKQHVGGSVRGRRLV